MLCRLLSLLTVSSIAVACSSSTHVDGPTTSPELVVGVQSEDLGALVGDVHIVVKLDGAIATDIHATLPGGLPKEIPVTGAAGQKVDVEVTGTGANDPPGVAPAVSRLASAHIPPSKKLLRVMLEQRCA